MRDHIALHQANFGQLRPVVAFGMCELGVRSVELRFFRDTGVSWII